jgi:hypothetical protein
VTNQCPANIIDIQTVETVNGTHIGGLPVFGPHEPGAYVGILYGVMQDEPIQDSTPVDVVKLRVCRRCSALYVEEE